MTRSLHRRGRIRSRLSRAHAGTCLFSTPSSALARLHREFSAQSSSCKMGESAGLMGGLCWACFGESTISARPEDATRSSTTLRLPLLGSYCSDISGLKSVYGIENMQIFSVQMRLMPRLSEHPSTLENSKAQPVPWKIPAC